MACRQLGRSSSMLRPAHKILQMYCVDPRPTALLQVQHPNCIKLFGVYITPRKVYLITELVTGGVLLDR